MPTVAIENPEIMTVSWMPRFGGWKNGWEVPRNE